LSSILAFIPARGGSKRIPGKNIKPFLGKPLIAYSIEYAKKCSDVDKVVVSTDDDEIKAVAEKLGAEVIMRPEDISGDFSPTAEAAKHTLEVLEKNNYHPEIVITLQATNPLRKLSILPEAIKIFKEEKPGALITVSKNNRKLGAIKNKRYLAQNYIPGTRSQDLEQLYFENGLLYLTSPELIRRGEIFGNDIYPMEVNDIGGYIDIDEPDEFEVAEIVYNKFKQNYE
jgi:N-acylneuraminate cytidylyltransferase